MFITNGISISPGIKISSENINLLNDYGTLWTFGQGRSGQLGTDNLGNVNYPVQVGNSNTWKQISNGSGFSLAIKNDGTLWAWGSNSSGELGLGNTTQQNTPVQVGNLNTWKQVSAGRTHTIALKTDGTLWSCGDNYFSSLGLGDNTNRNTLTQIGNSNNWKYISAGFRTSAAIKTDGTLWTWGNNNQGSLGLGDKVDRNVPTQVSITNCKQVYSFSNGTHMIAIDDYDSLWVWGNNALGQLGLGDNIEYLTPTSGLNQNWKEASVGYYCSAFINNDGTLWTSGWNTSGQLGLGLNDPNDTRNIITQIGNSTDWKHIYCGNQLMLAIKTDGTLWGWGYNSYGTLGLGNNSSPNLPTQAGTSTRWIQASSGSDYSTTAIQS